MNCRMSYKAWLRVLNQVVRFLTSLFNTLKEIKATSVFEVAFYIAASQSRNRPPDTLLILK